MSADRQNANAVVRVSRRNALATIAAGIAAAKAALTANGPAKGKRPNILFFLTDDQRRDAMSAYGNKILKTPNMDRIAAKGTPLARALMEKGLARPNDLGIGFATDRHGALLDASMCPSSVFFTIGPPRRGELFETTAVPELRVQAEELALHLLAS